MKNSPLYSIGGNIVLTFTDDSVWRSSITSAAYRPDGSSTESKLTPDTTTAGKLTLKAPSYTTGKGTLIVRAAGYRDFTAPIELITAVPGTVTTELQNDGSLVVAVSNSTYLGKISVTVDGNVATVTKSSGKLTIPATAFPDKKTYEVVLAAEGYADYSLAVNTDVQDAPALNAPTKPLEKQAFTIASGGSDWAEKITGATLLSGSYTYATYTNADITAQEGNATFAAKTGASAGSYTLKIYADGYPTVAVDITFVKAVPQGILLEGAEAAMLLNISDYSYRNAVQTIKIGETTLVRGTDFSTGSSPISLDKTKFPQEQTDIVITATGYRDYITTFNLGAIQPAPAVSLPEEIALTGDLVLTSEDSHWADSVVKLEIGKTSFSTVDKTNLTIEDGVITLPVDKFKGPYLSAGTGYTIKVYAEGYYTKQLSNVTFYAKGSSDFDKGVTWENGMLKINLSDGAYSYYNVDKVFVDGTEITSGLTKPTSATKPLIIPAGAHFTEKIGQTVTVKVTGTSSSYLPDLILQVEVLSQD